LITRVHLRQLTKEQLVSVLPLLLSRLESQEVVVYTYAAVALDRILSMRVGGSTTLMYALPTLAPTSALSSDLQVLICGRAAVRVSTSGCPLHQDRDPTQPRAHCGERLSHALCVVHFDPYTLYLTETFLGVARVIITAKQALVGKYVTVLDRLVNILRNVAQNPSNPNFDQYIFESISGLIL
jgi:exportin-2 (importin alpha re-exporter)